MTTETPHIADTSPHDWKYISEGGSTIVFSYSGPSHPHFDGTALRLRKGPVPAHEEPEKYAQPPLAHTLDEGEGVAEDELEEPDDPTIVFQHTVIERLVPKKHLPRLDAVHVERRWLQELAELTEPHRPLERRAKDRIDTSKRKAVLATDLVGGQGWAVEIKVRPALLPTNISTRAHHHIPPCRSPSGASSPRPSTSRPRRGRSRRGRAASACTRTSRARRARTSRSDTARSISSPGTRSASRARCTRSGTCGSAAAAP